MNAQAILLTALFVPLSTFIAYHGVKHGMDGLRMLRAGRYAEGTVIAMKPTWNQRKGRSWVSYSAVIAFETAWHEKREVDYADALGATAFKIGDQVKIWYARDDRSVFTLGGWYFVKDMASFFIFALCFGLPRWTLLIFFLKQYIHL